MAPFCCAADLHGTTTDPPILFSWVIIHFTQNMMHSPFYTFSQEHHYVLTCWHILLGTPNVFAFLNILLRNLFMYSPFYTFSQKIILSTPFYTFCSWTSLCSHPFCLWTSLCSHPFTHFAHEHHYVVTRLHILLRNILCIPPFAGSPNYKSSSYILLRNTIMLFDVVV